jgi:sortase (surface protein transpeptidase)
VTEHPHQPHDPRAEDDLFADEHPDHEVLDDQVDDEPAARRRLPAWLLPSAAALVAGVLVGAFLPGGSDDTAAAQPVAAAPAAPGAPAAQPAGLGRAEPVQVVIPSIGVDTSLVDLGLNGDGTLEVPVNFAKAGWFTGGNLPGDPSGRPALIAGHVDDHTGPAVFYKLRDLAVGQEVEVVRADNSVAVFEVTDHQQYPKDAFPADQVYAPVADSELVLITCTGAFDQTVRSYEDNLVVRARLDAARSLEETQARAAAGTPAPAADQPNV